MSTHSEIDHQPSAEHSAAERHTSTLNIKVRYIAASEPYLQHHANRHETLAELKPKALHFFHLHEGEGDGGTKVYEFVHGEVVLTNLQETVGAIAKHEHELHLKLVERFEQG